MRSGSYARDYPWTGGGAFSDLQGFRKRDYTDQNRAETLLLTFQSAIAACHLWCQESQSNLLSGPPYPDKIRIISV